MPIISVRDNENNRWNRNIKMQQKSQNKPKQKRTREAEAIVKSVRATWFCCAFKLVFP